MLFGGFHLQARVEKHVFDGREMDRSDSTLQQIDHDVAVRPAGVGTDGVGVLPQPPGDDALDGLEFCRGVEVRICGPLCVYLALVNFFFHDHSSSIVMEAGAPLSMGLLWFLSDQAVFSLSAHAAPHHHCPRRQEPNRLQGLHQPVRRGGEQQHQQK